MERNKTMQLGQQFSSLIKWCVYFPYALISCNLAINIRKVKTVYSFINHIL